MLKNNLKTMIFDFLKIKNQKKFKLFLNFLSSFGSSLIFLNKTRKFFELFRNFVNKHSNFDRPHFFSNISKCTWPKMKRMDLIDAI